MPVDINLVLTVFMWVFSLLIFVSNRKSSVNRWCSIGIMIFSLGGLKEYFYFSLVPDLNGRISIAMAENMYSVMTAILYYMAMPAALIFVLYFCSYDKTHPKVFRWVKRLLIVPCAMMMICYAPTQTRQFQLTDHVFWYVAMFYNLVYGVFMTLIMFHTLFKERNPVLRRQKRLVTIIAIPPIWYWLISIFVIHALQMKKFFKIWQGNLIIIVLLLLFYISMAFREGMMGLKLNSENYQWNSDMKMINRGAHYTSHILKNELFKIKWCVSNLRKKLTPEIPEEVEIISSSVDHLSDFMEKTMLYSDSIVLNKQECDIASILRNCIKSFNAPSSTISLQCAEHVRFYCDPTYVSEVINNLLQNAVDAICAPNGKILISCHANTRHRYQVISVSDNGCGMTNKEKQEIFNPYHTTKSEGTHFGLGLFYCYNVMSEHGGFIQVDSKIGCGSTFSLYFPKYKSNRKKGGKNVVQ